MKQIQEFSWDAKTKHERIQLSEKNRIAINHSGTTRQMNPV